MEQKQVLLLESYFNVLYAKAMLSVMKTVVKDMCDGCQYGSLSQTKHTCLVLSKEEQLNRYFEQIVNAVYEDYILAQW